MNKLPYTL